MDVALIVFLVVYAGNGDEMLLPFTTKQHSFTSFDLLLLPGKVHIPA